MQFKDIANAVMAAAPTLASVLLGPLGGAAVGMVTSVFGGNPQNLTDLAKRIASDPEAQAKLAQIENANKIELQKLYIQQLSMEQADRADARKREMAMAASGHRDIVLPFIAILFAAGYFIIQALILLNKLPASDIISARIQDALMLILSYYFGSSLGADKQK